MIAIIFALDFNTTVIFGSIVCFLLILKLIQMLRAEYKTDKIIDDVEHKFPFSNFDAQCDILRVEATIQKITFFSGEHEIGSCSQNVCIGNKEYKLTNRDFSNILSDNGQIIATSKATPNNRYSWAITFGLNVFVLESLDFGNYPYGAYQNGKGIGVIRSDQIIFPRAIPMEIQIFAYKVASNLYEQTHTHGAA